MKKLVVLLALSMLSALASCANGAADKGGVPAPQASNAQTETSEPSPTGTSEPAPADGVSGEAPDLGASVTSYTLENATLGGLTAAADDFTLTLIGENTLSGKLKASGNLTITGDGSLTISSGADDCINANGDITIDGGTLILSTQDDAVHSDAGLTINGGSVNILKSLEGLEAMVVTINGGDTRIAASDDAINASDGGTEEVAAQNPQGGRGGFGGDMVNNPALSVNITGGGVRLYAGTDGIDSNGGIVISGGTVLSFSTAAQTGGEGPIDANGESVLTPTLFVSGLALRAGSVLTVTDANGGEVFSETLAGDVGSMSLTLPGLREGETYVVSADGERLAETQALTAAQGMTPGGGFGGGFGGGDRAAVRRRMNNE